MRRFLTASLIFLALAASLPAQLGLGRGRISGDVVDESGAGLPGVLVTAQIMPGTTRLESKTDGKGHFAVGGLGSGLWRITASKDGFVSAYTELPVSQLKKNPPVKLTLTKSAESPGARADGQGRTRSSSGATAFSTKGRSTRPWPPSRSSRAKFPEIYGVRLNIATAHLKKGDLDRAEAEFRGVLDKASLDQGDAARRTETSLRALSGSGRGRPEAGRPRGRPGGLPPGPGDIPERPRRRLQRRRDLLLEPEDRRGHRLLRDGRADQDGLAEAVPPARPGLPQQGRLRQGAGEPAEVRGARSSEPGSGERPGYDRRGREDEEVGGASSRA